MKKQKYHRQYLSRSQFLVTGGAGFIGSNLVDYLLHFGAGKVRVLDNFSTGSIDNVSDYLHLPEFELVEGDIRNMATCRHAMRDMDYVLHQAALGSVPRSIEDPLTSNEVNVSGFLHVLEAAREARIKRMVYAASSSTYGDHPGLPKVEAAIGSPLSPYAVTKYVNELYADVFFRCYGLNSIGLRYFNIFGPRQDPEGAYAAVIPKWISAMLRKEPVHINGDGETSRDFCYIENAVQANLLAVASDNPEALNQVYNVALNERTSLNSLFEMQKALLLPRFPHLATCRPQYRDFREGDVRHSQADISKARSLLGYEPTHRIGEGLAQAMDWYVEHVH